MDQTAYPLSMRCFICCSFNTSVLIMLGIRSDEILVWGFQAKANETCIKSQFVLLHPTNNARFRASLNVGYCMTYQGVHIITRKCHHKLSCCWSVHSWGFLENYNFIGEEVRNNCIFVWWIPLIMLCVGFSSVSVCPHNPCVHKCCSRLWMTLYSWRDYANGRLEITCRGWL